MLPSKIIRLDMFTQMTSSDVVSCFDDPMVESAVKEFARPLRTSIGVCARRALEVSVSRIEIFLTRFRNN